MTNDKQALIDAIRAQWRTQLEEALNNVTLAKEGREQAIKRYDIDSIRYADSEMRHAIKDYELVLRDIEVEIARALEDME